VNDPKTINTAPRKTFPIDDGKQTFVPKFLRFGLWRDCGERW